jgi:hypothetical protein
MFHVWMERCCFSKYPKICTYYQIILNDTVRKLLITLDLLIEISIIFVEMCCDKGNLFMNGTLFHSVVKQKENERLYLFAQTLGHFDDIDITMCICCKTDQSIFILLSLFPVVLSIYKLQCQSVTISFVHSLYYIQDTRRYILNNNEK